jgi:hypothetical protein
MQRHLIRLIVNAALLFTSTSTLAVGGAGVANPIEVPPTKLSDAKVKVTIKDSLGGNWYVLDKQDEGTPKEVYFVKPTRLPDGSIKKLQKGWRMWIERVSPQSVKLSMKISNFSEAETFELEKIPTNKPQCQTLSLGDKTDSTAVCISLSASTKQRQGLW